MTDLRAGGAREQQSQQSREQIRDQAEQMRQQAEQMREHAQQMREQAQEAAREAQRAAEQAIRDAHVEGRSVGRVIRIPQGPPPPHPGETHTSVPPWQRDEGIPPEVVDIVGMMTFATAAVLILRPLMRAFANRFERRGAAPPALPPEFSAHMQRLEHAIEAVAIEVERISEGQRYTTKLLAERGGKEKVG
jgi:hypothetical protein